MSLGKCNRQDRESVSNKQSKIEEVRSLTVQDFLFPFCKIMYRIYHTYEEDMLPYILCYPWLRLLTVLLSPSILELFLMCSIWKVTEWFNVFVLKTIAIVARGFESHPFLINII